MTTVLDAAIFYKPNLVVSTSPNTLSYYKDCPIVIVRGNSVSITSATTITTAKTASAAPTFQCTVNTLAQNASTTNLDGFYMISTSGINSVSSAPTSGSGKAIPNTNFYYVIIPGNVKFTIYCNGNSYPFTGPVFSKLPLTVSTNTGYMYFSIDKFMDTWFISFDKATCLSSPSATCDALYSQYCNDSYNFNSPECACNNASPGYIKYCGDGICDSNPVSYTPTSSKSTACITDSTKTAAASANYKTTNQVQSIPPSYSTSQGNKFATAYGPYPSNINYRIIQVTVYASSLAGKCSGPFLQDSSISATGAAIQIRPINFNGDLAPTPLTTVVAPPTSVTTPIKQNIVVRTDMQYLLLMRDPVSNLMTGVGNIQFFNNGDSYDISTYLLSTDCNTTPNGIYSKLTPTASTTDIIIIPLNKPYTMSNYNIKTDCTNLPSTQYLYNLVNNSSSTISIWVFDSNGLIQPPLKSIPANSTLTNVNRLNCSMIISTTPDGMAVKKFIINNASTTAINVEVANDSDISAAKANIVASSASSPSYITGAAGCGSLQKYIPNPNAVLIAYYINNDVGADTTKLLWRVDENGFPRLILPNNVASNNLPVYFLKSDWLVMLRSPTTPTAPSKCVSTMNITTSNTSTTAPFLSTLLASASASVFKPTSSILSCKTGQYSGQFDLSYDSTANAFIPTVNKIVLFNTGTQPTYVAVLNLGIGFDNTSTTNLMTIPPRSRLITTLAPTDVIKLFSHKNECLGFRSWKDKKTTSSLPNYYFYDVTNKYELQILDILGTYIGKSGCGYAHFSSVPLNDTLHRLTISVLVYNNTSSSLTISYTTNDEDDATQVIGSVISPGMFWNTLGLQNSAHVYMIKDANTNVCVGDFTIPAASISSSGAQVPITSFYKNITSLTSLTQSTRASLLTDVASNTASAYSYKYGSSINESTGLLTNIGNPIAKTVSPIIVNDINIPIVIYFAYIKSPNVITFDNIKTIMSGTTWQLGNYTDVSSVSYTDLAVFEIHNTTSTGSYLYRFVNTSGSTIRMSDILPSYVSSISNFNTTCATPDYSGKYGPTIQLPTGAYLRNDTKNTLTVNKVILSTSISSTLNNKSFVVPSTITTVVARDGGDIFPNKYWFPSAPYNNDLYEINDTATGKCLSAFLLQRNIDGTPKTQLASVITGLVPTTIGNYVVGGAGCNLKQYSNEYDTPSAIQGQLINDTSMNINIYYVDENGKET